MSQCEMAGLRKQPIYDRFSFKLCKSATGMCEMFKTSLGKEVLEDTWTFKTRVCSFVKVMLIMFSDNEGLLFQEFLPSV